MIRELRPFDLPALVVFSAWLRVDEARSRDRVGGRAGGFWALLPLLRDCLDPGARRQTLIHTGRWMWNGLVSARGLGGPRALEVDRLLLAPGQEAASFELLERLSTVAARHGVEKLFLRLPADSPLLDMARRAGFSPYLTELLYRYSRASAEGLVPAALGLRPRSPADDYALFRLYCTTAPPRVRVVEGMTIEEWQQTRERCRSQELVYHNGEDLAAWLRLWAGRRSGQIDIVMQESQACPKCLVSYGLRSLNTRRPIFCLARDFQGALRSALEDQGFTSVRQYSCLVKQLAARAQEPQLVALRA